MNEILNIINQLANTSSRNEKEAILKKNSKNELLKKVLYYTYNPYFRYGISNATMIPVTGAFKSKYTDLFELLDTLASSNINNELRQEVGYFLSYIEPHELKQMYINIMLKDLKIGINTKTINKIFKDLIPSFNVMLAEKYFECEDKVTGEFIVTQKLDGIRCVIIKEYDSIKIFSRQGQPIDDLVEILDEAKLLPDNMVYDGELILVNSKNLASKDLYRETVKVARKDGVKKNLIFNCFDMLPIDGFKVGISKLECWRRKVLLHNTLKDMDLNFIVEVPILYQGKEKEMIIKLLDEAIAKDQEGVMVNIANAPYECKRTKSILKVKKMSTCDLRIVGFEEGEGKNKGTLGRINVSYKGNIVGVGSGFTDEMRNEIYNNQEKYLDKIAEIQYFEETTNSKDDKLSLRFPVFVDMRWDKTEESYY